MRWIKHGLIFEAQAQAPWMTSHAALPVVDGQRVYFSTRDVQGRSRVGSFDLDLARRQVLNVSVAPVIDLGPLGCFDDSGVTSSCIVDHDGRKYQFYSGWSLGVTVPFYLHVGLAISDDGGQTFRKHSRAPLLALSEVDPFLTASPCVLLEDGLWRMWYVSGTGWELVEGHPRHRYHIKYAESKDGLHWDRRGVVCIDYQSTHEYSIARPCVVKDGDVYRMWFCHRGASYRIGYAKSRDGIVWQRNDADAGIDVSPSGWDADMVAYPFVVDDGGARFMLYNGNGYGKTGVGLAQLERSERP